MNILNYIFQYQPELFWVTIITTFFAYVYMYGMCVCVLAWVWYTCIRGHMLCRSGVHMHVEAQGWHVSSSIPFYIICLGMVSCWSKVQLVWLASFFWDFLSPYPMHWVGHHDHMPRTHEFWDQRTQSVLPAWQMFYTQDTTIVIILLYMLKFLSDDWIVFYMSVV